MVKDEAQYKELLKKLIVQVLFFLFQGMLRMLERTVYVEGRKEHRHMLKQILPECESEFKRIMKKETRQDMESALQMSEYSLEERNKNIIGGIFMRSSDGRIVCDNSFDARVALIFEHLLPAIRAMLFAKK